MATNQMEVHHQRKVEPWRVTQLDTGDSTMAGGRLKRAAAYLEDDAAFHLTYCDGVSDVDTEAVTRFHYAHGMCATVTAFSPPGRYGALDVNGPRVNGFQEKTRGDGAQINGGFFVLDPRCLDLIHADSIPRESELLERLATMEELQAFEHRGFWRPIDALRDKNQLEEL